MLKDIDKSTQATGLCKFNLDDRVVLEASNLQDFNSYRNWGYFPGEMDPVWVKNAKENKQSVSVFPNFTVTKSLFNPVNGISANSNLQRRSSSMLLDTPAFRKAEKELSDCSIRTLVNRSQNGEMGRQIYRYADFMYCKYLGRVPNNYLITLRRFPYPCSDQISYLFLGKDDNEKNLQKHLPDIGRMVTWLGTPGNELENILKYKVKMSFKEMDAKIEETGDGGGDSGGLLGTMMNLGGNSAYRTSIMQGYAGSATLDYTNKALGWAIGQGNLMDSPQYQGRGAHRDNNKPYGPVDVIKKTHIRGDDGLVFENSFSLTFDYELRSYDGVNGKAAFLDLIANILATTYSSGKFWGGAYRGSGASQHNAFANLPIYKLNSGSSLSEVMSAVTDSISDVGKAMNGNKELSGNFLADAKSIISNMGKAFGQALLGGALNKLGRPMKTAVNSLLSPTPVGFWHVTIGNPMHPIVQMGNMIIDDCEIQQYGPLGLDDFPTGIKVTVTLKHGKSRDTTLFEQMFHYGDYRIYSPVDSKVKDAFEVSSRIEQMKREDYKTMFDYIKEENEEQARKLDEDYETPTKERVSKASSSKSKTTKNSDKKSNFMSDAKEIISQNTAALPGYVAKGIESLEKSTEKLKTVLLKHFGTTDSHNLVWAGQEGADGSSPPK